MAAKKKFPVRYLMFIGTAITKGHKAAAEVVWLHPDEVSKDHKLNISVGAWQTQSTLYTGMFRGANPGSVYSIQYDPNKFEANRSIFPKTARWVGSVASTDEHRELAIRAAAEQRAALAEIDAVNKSKKGAKRDPIEDALEPVLDAARLMRGQAKAQLIARVVYYIQRA